MKSLSIVTYLVLVATLAACNSGGSRKTVGQQCPGGVYKPTNDVVGANQEKLSLKVEDKKIPPGVYTYDGGQIYYEDVSGLRILTKDAKQKDQQFKASVFCVRNARNELHPLSLSGLTKMDVSADNKVLADVRDYTIDNQNAVFKANSTQSALKVESPGDFFVQKFTDYFLVKTNGNNTDFEIRAFGQNAGGKYSLSIRLKRADK